MNLRIILRILSRVSIVEAFLLGISACVGVAYGESIFISFVIPILALLTYGFLLGLIKPHSKDFFAKEGFICVALSWIQLSAFGALPFFLSGEIPSYIDSLFETISGFTTTGATILTNIEALPKGLLFWRNFTHWIGGMGVLVFLMAIVQLAGDRSMHLMRAEAPGPSVGKLVPRLRTTAAILYKIYLMMTGVEVILLLIGGLPLYDSVTTAFATAGTGGFSVKNASILAYDSLYVDVVVTLFMLLFGVNFNLYYLVLLRKSKNAFKSEEFQWYLGVFAVSTVLVTVNILPLCRNFGDALRLAAFQNASIMSTTGFVTADFNQWPAFSHAVMILLMIIGSCAGSTGGGFKISRLVILLKAIRREISRMLHPRSVGYISFEGKPVDAEVGHGVLVYLAVYVVLSMFGFLIISIDGFDHTTTVTAVLTAMNNVGPGLSLVGPVGNFSIFSDVSKLTLSAYMLIGRLEIFPILLLFSPTVWRRAKLADGSSKNQQRV